MIRERRTILGPLVAAAMAGLFLSGCGTTPPAPSSGGAAGEGVRVLYAAALSGAMQNAFGPAYEKATGGAFEGDAAGSKELAAEIRARLERADVFISASPSVNATLMGAKNGNWVRWYVPFASSAVVLAYTPRSPFASRLRTEDWMRVVTSKGFHLGRTDPTLDPMGALAVQILERAQGAFRREGFAASVLRASEVVPEEDVIGRLASGQVDAAFLYRNQASEMHLPYVSLSGALTEKAIFTVTIPANAPDRAGAVAFVHLLLSRQGTQLLEREGLTPETHRLSGNRSALPPDLSSVVAK